MSVTSYRDLEVWRQAMDWAQQIYEATSRWPHEERFGLISQIRRASVSVVSNIAEGAERRGTGEFLHFIGIAQGSLAEAETQLILAQRLTYVSDDGARLLLRDAGHISRMLASLAGSLQRRRAAHH